jgi:hypothetical protein
MFDYINAYANRLTESQGLRVDWYSLTSVYEENRGEYYTLHFSPRSLDGDWYEADLTPAEIWEICNGGKHERIQ